jgi:hypothetical protein
MSTQLRIDILTAAEWYLEHTPDHRFGFCFWAVRFLDPVGVVADENCAWHDDIYRLVDQIRKEMAYNRNLFCDPLSCYVSRYNGYNEERAQFVADLRAFLLSDL